MIPEGLVSILTTNDFGLAILVDLRLNYLSCCGLAFLHDASYGTIGYVRVGRV